MFMENPCLYVHKGSGSCNISLQLQPVELPRKYIEQNHAIAQIDRPVLFKVIHTLTFDDDQDINDHKCNPR